MARTLILGGTRNLGHAAALSLLGAGHTVSILNRGVTPDDLPPEIERMRADRADDASMRAAIGNRSFDVVLDNTTYTEREARQAVGLFTGRAGRYVFISSGQVYLVRENLPRPFHEADYDGPIMAEPKRQSDDHAAWTYGIDKRSAEQVFMDAAQVLDFPITTLRLPMIASERDHYGRIQGYIARLLDGQPLLIPDETGLPLRHVYVNDVARIVTALTGSKVGIGESFNVSYNRSLALPEFLVLLGAAAGTNIQLVRVKRKKLESRGLLPDCSPFSGRWMSELDSTRAASAFGCEFSAPSSYLASIVDDYRERWIRRSIVPDSYRQRQAEVAFLESLA
jgi:nucleoside-diphosphate-sugar epimerase